jgi:hypothetical protein
LATSRSQSEAAVSEMMQAFSSISPHVELAERQSLQISDALRQDQGSGNGQGSGLAQACEAALAPLLHNPQLPPGGAEAIQSALALVRDAVTALAQISQPLTHETHEVAKQVERMYMGFQYQDRISQMMALLEADMARLQALIAENGADAPDLPVWLRRLEDQYAMADQRQSHVGVQGASPDAGPDQETTFF